MDAAMVVGLVALGALIILVVAIEVTLGDRPLVSVEDPTGLRGPPRPDADVWHSREIDVFERDAAVEPEASIHQSYEWSELIDVDHLRGMDAVDDLLADLAEAVVDATRRPRRRPRRPTSILLHGPPGGAMTVLAHVFANRFRARLVQIFASRTIATNNGGSQPLIAVAVHEARMRLPSVLLLDELDLVAAPDVKDTTRQRAANDLINESLRPVYGVSHVVIAMFTTDGEAPPRALQQMFEHVRRVDVPELERALVKVAVRTTEHELLRGMPAKRLAHRADVRRGSAFGEAA